MSGHGITVPLPRSPTDRRDVWSLSRSVIGTALHQWRDRSSLTTSRLVSFGSRTAGITFQLAGPSCEGCRNADSTRGFRFEMVHPTHWVQHRCPPNKRVTTSNWSRRAPTQQLAFQALLYKYPLAHKAQQHFCFWKRARGSHQGLLSEAFVTGIDIAEHTKEFLETLQPCAHRSHGCGCVHILIASTCHEPNARNNGLHFWSDSIVACGWEIPQAAKQTSLVTKPAMSDVSTTDLVSFSGGAWSILGTGKSANTEKLMREPRCLTQEILRRSY